MTPQDFITQWGAPGGVPGPAYALNEEQGAQSHFLDLCELLGVPKPGSREGYRFEEKSAIIPLLADSYIENMSLSLTNKGPVATKIKANSAACTSTFEAGVVRMSGPILKSNAYEAPASEPAAPGAPPTKPVSKSPANHNDQPATEPRANTSTQNQPVVPIKQGQEAIKTVAFGTARQHAEHIASAAKRLNDLREAWLNPPEWTHRVPEVVPLGMSTSPYPDRIEPRHGINEVDLKALQKRTLTNLYNLRPAWLTLAHQQLDVAVAATYGWADYSAAVPDEDILRRLLALNLARSSDSAAMAARGKLAKPLRPHDV